VADVLDAGGCPSLHGERKCAHVADSINIGITGPQAVQIHARETWRGVGGRGERKEEKRGVIISMVQ